MNYPLGLLTVDLNAIQANWLRLNECLVSSTHCGAVVKANAYGLGMCAIAKALLMVGCQQFFVVNCVEGVALRKALGRGPIIYVLQGCAPGQEQEYLRANLTPVLISYNMAQRWLAFCDAHSIPITERRSAVKTNTGMHRLGLEHDELLALLEDGRFESLGCQLLMSHLACADEPEHPLNGQQRECFQQQYAQVRRVCPGVRGSLANSAATLQGEAWHFDLVRPGIALYGANATGRPEHQMAPVVTLELPVIQKRRVSAGSAVGYGATYIANSTCDLVTVCGGYGDGLFRSLGNQGHVWWKQRLPIVGRVSMDSFVVDVTALPEKARPNENQLVEFLGAHQTVDAVAQAAGTVAYEILTRLTGRYARRYHLNGHYFDAADF